MCGIAGEVLRHGRGRAEVVDKQLALLMHRGPDAAGTFARGFGAIGQSRLSIIDLDTGDPPISDESGEVGVALNGEIYNFRTLRDELAAAGHTFTTKGDTEVIAHLAEASDPVGLAQSLHGMFALAVLDARRDRLVLARDRFGKKPLYYWHDDSRLVFASEIKALLAHPDVPADLDEGALPAYLTFGYVPTPRTFFRGIRTLPPGHVLVLDRADWAVREERYWALPLPGVHDGPAALDVSLDEAAELVWQHLRDAVERRLVADVPLGAFLSGGIDSSAVVAAMAELVPGRVKTFAIGFDDTDGFDERPAAATVARHLGTDHTEFVVHADAVELIETLVWHHDQPFGDSSAIPTYLLSKVTRDHVTVALSGDGGDEAFGGYERFAAALAMMRLDAIPRPVRSAVAAAAARLPAARMPRLAARGARMLRRASLDPLDAYLSWIEYTPREVREWLLPAADAWAQHDYAARWAATDGADPLNRLLALNIDTYLLDDLLVKVDRMSMAHGLEVRCPLLDHDLVALSLRLPRAAKVRGPALKRVLKHALRGRVPDEILARRKHGFGVPLDRWLRTSLEPYARGMLASPTSRIRGHVRPDAVERLLAEHHAGGANHGHVIWTLLTLEVFLRARGW